MFESLTEKLGQALRNLRGVGTLTEENMADALKEVRTALLSADVHFKVAREFVERVPLPQFARSDFSSRSRSEYRSLHVIGDAAVRRFSARPRSLACMKDSMKLGCHDNLTLGSPS